MSDLGAIFHVKKDGVQYDAHAYTTLDECPEPNLKLTYKGQQGYVKLETKGSGDVPCYVKTKAGNTYQVKKEAIPTGEVNIHGSISFTVPAGIKIIKVTSDNRTSYVGVNPNSVHALRWKYIEGNNASFRILRCHSHSDTVWIRNEDYDYIAKLSWSPEINKQTPTVTDYH
nr:MAG TPA: hypothetical protein [Caudoviricetes sp.]